MVLVATCNLKLLGHVRPQLWEIFEARHANNIDIREHAKVFALKSRMECIYACKEIIRNILKKGKEMRATHSVSNSSAFNEIFSLGTSLLLNK